MLKQKDVVCDQPSAMPALCRVLSPMRRETQQDDTTYQASGEMELSWAKTVAVLRTLRNTEMNLIEAISRSRSPS